MQPGDLLQSKSECCRVLAHHSLSIIIAQITNASHFARRTVYLSLTEKHLLSNRLKLQGYLSSYSEDLPVYSTWFNGLFNTRLLQSTLTTFGSKTITPRILKLQPYNLRVSNENTLLNLISLYKQYFVLRSTKKSRITKLLRVTLQRRKKNTRTLKKRFHTRTRMQFLVKKSKHPK